MRSRFRSGLCPRDPRLAQASKKAKHRPAGGGVAIGGAVGCCCCCSAAVLPVRLSAPLFYP
eukprot:16059051-Heterocapsa_arctica.AAC.1